MFNAKDKEDKDEDEEIIDNDIDKIQVANDFYQNDQADEMNNDIDNVDADWRKIT